MGGLNVFLGILVIMGTCKVMAGGATSGGGGAYVCRDDEKKIASSKIVDLWEAAKIPYNWAMGQQVLPIYLNQSDYKIQLDKALKKLDAIDTGFSKQVRAEWAYLENHLNYLTPEVSIALPSDLNISYFPSNCPAEGMMRFNDITSYLDVKKEIFEKLETATDVAGAWGHEAIYKVLREKANHASSLFSRRLNACLFSDSECLPATSINSDISSSQRVYQCTQPLADYYLVLKDHVSTGQFPDISNWRILYTRLGKSEFSTRTYQDFVVNCEQSNGRCFGFSDGPVVGGLESFDYAPSFSFLTEVQLVGQDRELEWAYAGGNSSGTGAGHELTLEGPGTQDDPSQVHCKKIK